MHNAATIAGIGFGNSMAALAHALGHALGAEFHVPHGRAVGLFLPYTIEYSAGACPDRYSDIARFLGLAVEDETEAAGTLAGAIRALLRELGQPAAIQEMGISAKALEAALPHLVDNAETDTQIVMSARIPDYDEAERLFRYAFAGKMVDF
jgi:alcohol dehydrogenase class IV